MFKHTPARRLGVLQPIPDARPAVKKSAAGPMPSGNPIAEAGDRAEVQRLIRLAGEIGTSDSYSGKRRERRIRGGLRLELTTDPALGDGAWMVFMHDISETGFALWSKKPVTHRMVVYVRECSESQPGPWVRARVSRCGRGIRGYLVGCMFEPAGS